MANEGTDLLEKPADVTPDADPTKVSPEPVKPDTKPEGETTPEPKKDGEPPKADDKGDLLSKKEPEVKPVVAPEKYTDPKLPETLTLDPEFRKELDTTAKELNLSQEGYQKIVDLGAKLTEKNVADTMAQFEKIKTEWREQTVKELGPDFEKQLAAASKAIDTVFADPKENQEFRARLSENGMSNWNLMVRFCNYFGKAISEDTSVPGGKNVKTEKSTAEILFDNPTSGIVS